MSLLQNKEYLNDADLRPRVLIVDDDPDMLTMLQRAIARKCDCDLQTAESGEKAWQLLDSWQPDVILTDVKMPGLDGLSLLRKVKERDPSVSVLMMTGYGTIELAVQALKEGAYDFFEKPFDKDHLIHALLRCLERVNLLRENRRLHEQLEGRVPFQGFVGRSKRLRDIFDLLTRVADTDVTVLIRGESGTGKELAARALHSLSRRAQKQMVTVNCPALPEHILESELFGYAKGAFTGAEHDKIGLFLEADGSTILLDEIGDIPTSLQTKLLRVLQEKEIMPLGQTKSTKVDVRVLASTNQDLEKKIQRGLFREDLFYRLNVVTVTMPSLKEVPEDIPVLAEHFLNVFGHEYKREGLAFSPEALQFLISRPWKGNVRELQNVVKRAVLLAPDRMISQEHLVVPEKEISQTPQSLPSVRHLSYNEAKQEILKIFSEDYIVSALQQSCGNVTAAARASGLGRQAFQRLMRRYGVKADAFRERKITVSD